MNELTQRIIKGLAVVAVLAGGIVSTSGVASADDGVVSAQADGGVVLSQADDGGIVSAEADGGVVPEITPVAIETATLIEPQSAPEVEMVINGPAEVDLEVMVAADGVAIEQAPAPEPEIAVAGDGGVIEAPAAAAPAAAAPVAAAPAATQPQTLPATGGAETAVMFLIGVLLVAVGAATTAASRRREPVLAA
jgi:LPXTG-motif cell wall-anchored protein